jgi:hypothetical protein
MRRVLSSFQVEPPPSARCWPLGLFIFIFLFKLFYLSGVGCAHAWCAVGSGAAPPGSRLTAGARYAATTGSTSSSSGTHEQPPPGGGGVDVTTPLPYAQYARQEERVHFQQKQRQTPDTPSRAFLRKVPAAHTRTRAHAFVCARCRTHARSHTPFHLVPRGGAVPAATSRRAGPRRRCSRRSRGAAGTGRGTSRGT